VTYFSYSSVMVVEAMRSLRREMFSDFYSISSLEKFEIGTCFLEYVKFYLDLDFSDRMITRISDLTCNEEMMLLSTIGLDKVWIRADDSDPSKMTNHIQREEFDGAVEMSAYMLHTPLFREVRFFASNLAEEDFTMLDEEIIQESISVKKKISSSSLSEDSKSLVVLDDDGKAKKKGNKIWEADFVREQYMGTLCTEWTYERFMVHYRNMGMNDEVLAKVYKSKLAPILYENRVFDPYLLRLYHMEFSEFKMIAYFFGNLKDLSVMVFSLALNKWKQMHSILPKMFYEKFKDLLNLNENNFEEEFVKFEMAVDDMDEFQVQSMEFLVGLLKNRIFNHIYMYEHMRNDDASNNTRKSAMKVEENMDFNTENKLNMYEKIKMSLDRSVKSREAMDISKFQPLVPTTEFFRNNPDMASDFHNSFSANDDKANQDIINSIRALNCV